MDDDDDDDFDGDDDDDEEWVNSAFLQYKTPTYERPAPNLL